MGKINKNYLNLDKKIENIENLLAEDEKILWQGSPNKSAYFWTRFLNKFYLILLWLVIDIAFIVAMIAFNVFSEIPLIASIVICVFFILHLTPVWIWLYGVLKARKNAENIKYFITSQRIVFCNFYQNAKIESLYYKDIDSININIGKIDRKYKVGDIYISSKNGTRILEDVETPYELTGLMQKFLSKLNTNFKK